MSIASFFTLQTFAPGQTGAAAQTALGGPVGINGLGFLDFILAQLGQTPEGEKAPEASGPLQSDNPVLDKNPKLDLAELLEANPDISEEVKALALGNQDELTKTLMLNQKAFDEILKPLINSDGTITINGKNIKLEAGKAEAVFSTFVINSDADNRPALLKLKSILTKIENSPSLIATDMTPEQITELRQKIEDILKGKSTDDETLSQLVIGYVHITPPQAEKSAVSADVEMPDLPSSFKEIATASGLDDKPQPVNNSKANDLSSGGKEAPSKPNLSALQGWKFSPEGSILTPPPSFDEMMQSWGYGPSAPTVTGLQNAANPVMQSHSAAAPVPAMQVIAATVQKAATDGETKNIRLQLEPPELGRIEVRMNFSKDKTVKAVLMAEKPETLAMLQRDSFHLERALQNAGLEATGSSLSFELADSGYDFNHNGGHDGHGGNSGGNASGDESEIIQSTMSWYVDPETGHMRYNLMV